MAIPELAPGYQVTGKRKEVGVEAKASPEMFVSHSHLGPVLVMPIPVKAL